MRMRIHQPQIVHDQLVRWKVRNVPPAPNAHPFPDPRRSQQLDRPVRPRDEVRLAPTVVDGAVSPMSHRANGKHYPRLRVRAKHAGKGAVQGLGDFVD